jgi:hypothetical protein
LNEQPPTEFEKAATGKETSLVRDLFDLLRKNKKWWLLPILVMLALVGVIVFLGTTKAAAFIYPLF